MHIEPGLVSPEKLALSYATGAAALAFTGKLIADETRAAGLASLAIRSLITTTLVFCFFELLPHPPVGVSEVHLILGSTLFLVFGRAAAASGLALGLLAQGLTFAPFDLPQYGMNVTTLLVPLFALSALAQRVIPKTTPYVALKYRQVLALSAAYQGGIVAWVTFWAVWGQGLGGANLAAIGTFGAAYMLVVLVEPLVDLAALFAAKQLSGLRGGGLVQPRLYGPA